MHAIPAPSPSSRVTNSTGLRYWMLQVLEECDNVSANFSPDSVHDLRVSLRRCRSLADGIMALDPNPEWKAMKKAGKRLFQRLGDLRDIHVMQEWVEKLEKSIAERTPLRQAQDKEKDKDKDKNKDKDKKEDKPSSSVLLFHANPDSSDAVPHSAPGPAQSLLRILSTRETEQKREAQAALKEFDNKQWRRWSRSLPARAGRIRPGSPLFKHLALERWTAARDLHNRALRNRSQVAFHSLRIGIKRFRYIVENFLPAEHKMWSADLKEIQDLLGEVHDLDVLWSTAVSCHIFPDAPSRALWRQQILAQRTKRIDGYRAKMVGPDSLWLAWRSALPQGKQIQALATSRMKLWANGLDPDFPHSERVASLALQLYDGLLALAWQPALDASSARFSLLAAALLHDVGKFKGGKGHHKVSLTMIRKHGNPLGWKAAELQRAAVVARFHRGALPARKHKLLRDLLPDEQKAIIQLAAILRLANALDAGHDGRIGRIQVENSVKNNAPDRAARVHKNLTGGFLLKPNGLAPDEALLISAEGYSPLGPYAQTIAAERHLLETVLRRPVLIKATKHSTIVG